MPFLFALWVECNSEQENLFLAQHFNSFQPVLTSKQKLNISIEIINEPAKSFFAVQIIPLDLSRFGVRTLVDALVCTEVGLLLYHHLKTAPDFQFARVDWEPQLITMKELSEWLEPMATGEYRLPLNCVMSDNLYNQLGKPRFFFPFRKGYWWNKYDGETYRPLNSGDQPGLTNLHRQLFPENFGY
jgi:hypothetical protein